MKPFAMAVLIISAAQVVAAHDTWVETNTTFLRKGDAVYVDLKLGNHGNHHRDFKLASKIDRNKVSLQAWLPDGGTINLKERLIDTGYGPKEGYWSTKVVTAQTGLHLVDHTLDTLHGSTRAIKGAKSFYYVAGSLESLPSTVTGYDRPLGHALELIPLTNPLAAAGPGHPLEVKLLFKGKPLADAVVSFVPRGELLAEGFDDNFERKTDQRGVASFTPKSGNRYLVVVHHVQPDEKGTDYDSTAYSATLTVLVPEISLLTPAQ